MNNWFKRLIQRKYEFATFRRFLAENRIDLRGKTIMDAGCGSGQSSLLIMKEYQPEHLIAFDFMPEQIELARKKYPGIEFETGDLRHITTESGSCDAVFIFGVLHHIPEWKKALEEVHRVLTDGGAFLLEEPHYRFSWDELEMALQETGFSIKACSTFVFGYFHSYLYTK
jgi:ubiquinone/menaquinone biosynthesis C-methylase UbiE